MLFVQQSATLERAIAEGHVHSLLQKPTRGICRNLGKTQPRICSRSTGSANSSAVESGSSNGFMESTPVPTTVYGLGEYSPFMRKTFLRMLGQNSLSTFAAAVMTDCVAKFLAVLLKPRSSAG